MWLPVLATEWCRRRAQLGWLTANVLTTSPRPPVTDNSPFPAQSLGPIGAEFRPTNPSQLYVSNAHAGAGLGTVSAFQLSRTGVLSSIGNSPVADGQTAPC
jgi:hypothetical protein